MPAEKRVLKGRKRFLWRPRKRASVTCEWCGQRWSVGADQDSPALAEIWIGECSTVLCPDCFQPTDFGE